MIKHTWTHDTVLVELWYDHWRNGRDYLGYRLLDSGRVIFEGVDFSPSPLFAWDSEDAVMALLGFLTLQPGDTDEEYFEGHSQEQLDWIMGESAEELRMVWLDFEYAKE